jgi:ATP-dependent Clp protease ATP-binding subunit ClpC
MDEAGGRARISSMTRPPDIKEIEKDIETIRAEKETAIKAQDFEKAAALRDSEKRTKDNLEQILNDWREQREEREVVVTGDDIIHIVSKWTGVPLNRMEQKEAQKLLKMEEELKERVIGQDEAVIAVSKALRRARADLKDPRRPIGSFIFLGPTGVGKTFLARAEFMFGDADALIQIDMSEYMDKFTASRLIGSQRQAPSYHVVSIINPRQCRTTWNSARQLACMPVIFQGIPRPTGTCGCLETSGAVF